MVDQAIVASAVGQGVRLTAIKGGHRGAPGRRSTAAGRLGSSRWLHAGHPKLLQLPKGGSGQEAHVQGPRLPCTRQLECMQALLVTQWWSNTAGPLCKLAWAEKLGASGSWLE